MTIRKIENARQEECDYINYTIYKYKYIYLYIVYYICKFIQQSQNS